MNKAVCISRKYNIEQAVGHYLISQKIKNKNKKKKNKRNFKKKEAEKI